MLRLSVQVTSLKFFTLWANVNLFHFMGLTELLTAQKDEA